MMNQPARPALASCKPPNPSPTPPSPRNNSVVKGTLNGFTPWPSRKSPSGALFKRLLLLALTAISAHAAVDRVVILKVDGLPERFIERYVAEVAAGRRAGHSRLPWIEHVFVDNGSWIENFYVRGISLSSPSWSELDTGHHLEVRGNAEWDRYTLRVFDYMNFFPLYANYARNQQADMPGVELLDENHVPLLIDRFPFDQRYQSFQLYQRGVRWNTLEHSLGSHFAGRSIKDVFDEWQTGLTLSAGLSQEQEHELIAKLDDPNVHYLDFFTGDFDHSAHLTADHVTLEHVLESLDALVGRLWTAIAASPLAKTTAFVMVSDHGMNNQEGVYSQGYNLIDWFDSPTGGAHHVMINRHPMTEFKLKGLDPFVTEVITPSQESAYLAGEAQHYPTAVMDLDGNERASIGLRNNSLNVVQILLDQLTHKKLTGRVRRAALNQLFSTLDHVRPLWSRNVAELALELKTLRFQIADQQKLVDAQPKSWTADDKKNGLDLEAKRQFRVLDRMKTEERLYSAYVGPMLRLLALDPADFDPGKFNMEELVPRRSLGEPNSIYDLQNYVAGPSKTGLVAGDDGELDLEHSFRHVDYFTALSAIRVRNNVQKDVGPQPVDFIAVPLKNSIWLRSTIDRQALIETRVNAGGIRELHYIPIANLTQDEAGQPHYDRAEWAPGFPLEMFNDPQLNVEGDRSAWLNDWHTEAEWLNAVHRTRYSDGVIGIVEALLRDPVPDAYLERKRELRSFDMIVFANDHWNFNVRSFNPGGNHGSFLRVSAHSVLMFAGGDETGIPKSLRVSQPYDSLSVVPTILTLMGRPDQTLPGPVINEIMPFKKPD
jgi:hypothetical protein